MSEMPETLRNLGYHLRVMADKASEQIDADRLSRAADEVERADLPPTLSAAMELPEVKALVEAAKNAGVSLFEAEDKFHVLSFYLSDEASLKCAKERVEWMRASGASIHAALAAIKEPKT